MKRLAVGLLAALALAAPAEAAEVLVRTEGRTTTLFEGRLEASGHAIRAASDTQSRPCDGTNNGANPTPGPTPTSATVDALATIGQDFDGEWYLGFDDYFIERFGPDAQDENTYAYWGVYANRVLTSVGGCQYRLNAGDLALWVYDAFSGRPLLRLDGPGGHGEPTSPSEGAPPATPVISTFTVAPGEPLPLSVVTETGPAAGVLVAPVATAADGVQTVLRSDAATVTTDAAGQATLTWSTPGWKRIKADANGYVRSNRLDVCVTPCTDPPPDVPVRTPPDSTVPDPTGPQPGSGSLALGPPKRGELVAGPVRVRPRITTDGNPTGLVGVRWSLRGSGLREYAIESRVRGGRWKRQARGTAGLSALLDLPIGRVSELRMRIVATTGETATARFGRVLVPRDERVRALRFAGLHRAVKDPLAWRQTVTLLKRGGRLATRLPAGRPALVVRGARNGARIEVRAAGRRQVVRVAARRDGATRFAIARRREAGLVRFRVIEGSVSVDGVAVTP